LPVSSFSPYFALDCTLLCYFPMQMPLQLPCLGALGAPATYGTSPVGTEGLPHSLGQKLSTDFMFPGLWGTPISSHYVCTAAV